MKNKCICINNFNFLTNFTVGKVYNYTDKSFVYRKHDGTGYNVRFSHGEYLFFTFDNFNKYFKTIKQLRKEKIKQINGTILL